MHATVSTRRSRRPATRVLVVRCGIGALAAPRVNDGNALVIRGQATVVTHVGGVVFVSRPGVRGPVSQTRPVIGPSTDGSRERARAALRTAAGTTRPTKSDVAGF